jgi:hypothetical protein
MTRERCKELLPVMEAWARGEVIEYRYRDRNRHADAWSIIPDFARFGESDVFEFRIKPKPLEVWGVWCDSTENPITQNAIFRTEAKAREALCEASAFRCKGAHRIIKLREVEEGQ